MNMADTSSESSEDDKAMVSYSRDDNLHGDLDLVDRQGASDPMIWDDLKSNRLMASAYNVNPLEYSSDERPSKRLAQRNCRIEPMFKVAKLELIGDVHGSHAVNPKTGNGAFVCYTYKETGQDVKKSLCDNCMFRGITARDATVICFDCDSYLCSYCSMTHRTHNLLRCFDQGNKRSIYQRLAKDLKEELDKYESLRAVKIHKKHSIHIRVGNDKNCFITGMTNLSGNLSVLADYNNSSVKIVDLSSNKIIRMIRFDKKPWGVKKVCMNESGNMSDSVIAITFPRAREITLLDLNVKNSAEHRAYRLFNECFDIEIFKQQYITLCYISDPEDPGARYYLYFLDISGITGKVIKLYSDPGVPLSGQFVSFTVHEDAIFVSCMDKLDGVVLSFDFDGQLLNKRPSSRPAGICMNQDKDIVITSFEVPEDPFCSAFSNITGLTQDLKLRYSQSLGTAVYFLHSYKDHLYTCHFNLHTNEDTTGLDALYILQVE